MAAYSYCPATGPNNARTLCHSTSRTKYIRTCKYDCLSGARVANTRIEALAVAAESHISATTGSQEQLFLPSEPTHNWGNGSGLSVEQFVAALSSLPLQKRVQWKSLYPAIGEGARGKVFQAVNLETGGMLAVKVVPLTEHMGPSREAALRREALVLELAAMQDYRHPNLLSMQGFYYRPSASNPKLEIFSELGCCLEDIMPEQGQPRLPLGLVQKVMTALVSALDFLHVRGVVHRDVKPGNIVSVGSGGTFKLIDMDSMYLLQRLEQQQRQGHPQQQGLLWNAHQQQYHQQQQPMGRPGPQAISTHTAGQAAAKVATAAALERQLQLQQPPVPKQQPALRRLYGGVYTNEYSVYVSDKRRQHRQELQVASPAVDRPQGLDALSYAGTPENMAPEVAPLVLEPSVVMWDLIPLKAGRQVASGTAVHPAQDVWSVGTVMWELVMGRALWDDFDCPEALFQHFEKLRCIRNPGRLPVIPSGLDQDVVQVLQACLQLDPLRRPTARQLLDMAFFTKVY